MTELSREASIALYCYGVIDDLKRDGIMEGGQFSLTDQGKEAYAQLRDSGFQPTQEEMRSFMRSIDQTESNVSRELPKEAQPCPSAST